MMVISNMQPAGGKSVWTVVSGGLRILSQKIMSILPDFDPMMQILALILVMKMADGFTLDKDTMVGTGMLAMMLFEELI